MFSWYKQQVISIISDYESWINGYSMKIAHLKKRQSSLGLSKYFVLPFSSFFFFFFFFSFNQKLYHYIFLQVYSIYFQLLSRYSMKSMNFDTYSSWNSCINQYDFRSLISSIFIKINKFRKCMIWLWWGIFLIYVSWCINWELIFESCNASWQ